jgi:hypothetical protein
VIINREEGRRKSTLFYLAWFPFQLQSKVYLTIRNQDRYYMTLYFKDITAIESPNTRICVDGDLSGWLTYRLQLTSRYTNREVDNDTSSWLLPIDILVYNERYTEFDVAPYIDTIETGLYTGIYDYEIWGAPFNTDYANDTFEEAQWRLLQNGQAKVKSKTTVDMQRGSNQNITVKYKSEPNTAQSYVIYK